MDKPNPQTWHNRVIEIGENGVLCASRVGHPEDRDYMQSDAQAAFALSPVFGAPILSMERAEGGGLLLHCADADYLLEGGDDNEKMTCTRKEP